MDYVLCYFESKFNLLKSLEKTFDSFGLTLKAGNGKELEVSKLKLERSWETGKVLEYLTN